MTGIHHHRQMAQLMKNGDGGQIQRVAGIGFKGADATLAKDHFFIALTHDVLSAHQQLLQCVCKTALE